MGVSLDDLARGIEAAERPALARALSLAERDSTATAELLSRLAQPSAGHKLRMMMTYARRFEQTEVPDPYYGDQEGFEQVLDMLEDAAQGLLESIRGKK